MREWRIKFAGPQVLLEPIRHVTSNKLDRVAGGGTSSRTRPKPIPVS
jgi:hypothetical protein